MTSSCVTSRESEAERSTRATGGTPVTSQIDSSPQSPHTESQWPDLVRRLRMGDRSAMEDLYRVFSEGVRFYLWRQLGPQDLTDKLHDLFLIVTQSIQSGELREPERLMGYVRTVVRRQVAGHIQVARRSRLHTNQLDFGAALPDGRFNPETDVIRQQYSEVALRILSSMRKPEREVLMRFYLQEQSAAEICREMRLTETQFRLLKSRAKARLGKLCQSRLKQAPRTPVFSSVQ